MMVHIRKRDIQPRVLFYSHDGRGLGHLRMMLPLASEVAIRDPDAAVLVITGSSMSHTISSPPNLEVVTIPSKASGQRLSNLLPAPESGYTIRGLWAMRESLIHATVRSFDPHILVGDNLPGGLLGELERAVRLLSSSSPKAGLILTLTDVPNDPNAIASAWQSSEDVPVGSLYDRVIVLGSRAVYDPILECNFPPEAAGRTHFCGYLQPARGSDSEEKIRAQLGVEEALVVVTVGGGELGVPVIDAYLDALEKSDSVMRIVTSLVVMGPNFPAEERTRLISRSELIPRLHVVDFLDNLVDHIAAADVVVTRGGFNAVSEVVGLGKRAIVIPHDGALGEQRIRAERFSALGLVRCLLPSELTAESLGEAVVQTFRSEVSPPDILDFNGIDCTADIIETMLDDRLPLWSPRALRATRIKPKPNTGKSSEEAKTDRDPGSTDRRIAVAWDRTRFYTDSRNLIESSVDNRRGFEIELLKEMAILVIPGDHVIDCGANIGSHACSLARRVGPAGRVIAIEPVPFLADRLEANRMLNDLENLVVVRGAVSSTKGRRVFTPPDSASWNQGNGSFHWTDLDDPGEAIEVDTTTIDEIVRKFELQDVRLLKLDIEGHEHDAFLGAHEVLASFRPYVFFEYHREAWDMAGWKLSDATRLLCDEFGYRIFPVGPEDDDIRIIGARHPDKI